MPPNFLQILQALGLGQQQQAAPFDIVGAIKALQPQNKHFGIGGQEITDANPRGDAGGNPFMNGFFKSSAADLSPEQLALSQGNNAMNQWKFANYAQEQGDSSNPLNEQLAGLGEYNYPARTQNPMTFGSPTTQVPFAMPSMPPKPPNNTPEAMAWMDERERVIQQMHRPGGFWSLIKGARR